MKTMLASDFKAKCIAVLMTLVTADDRMLVRTLDARR
jgi:hypothetical protein